MKLGFHYHSTFRMIDGRIYVPGYIGVFIDSLAKETEELYLFLEEQTDVISQEEDYGLNAENIRLVNLGPKSTFYKRLLSPASKLEIIKKHAHTLDALLLRVPSPLGPHIFNALHSKVPVYSLVVGNYVKGLKDLKQPFLRKAAIVALTYYYQWLHNAMIRKSRIFVNSGALFDDYKNKSKEITLIKTTTLDDSSFYQREDTCMNDTIRVLFTGRINFQKGLRELIDAVASLAPKHKLHIDIVGWEEKGSFSYEEALKERAEEKGIASDLTFHGKKKIGPELQAYYKQADIYVIPSYHEGFPRTIWEAMAASLPVIATTVGSIPYYLNNEEHGLLVPPRDTASLAAAIERIISDQSLRKQLISNGFETAQDVTLEKQTGKLINQIKSYINLE